MRAPSSVRTAWRSLGAVLIGLIYAVAFVPLQYFIDKVTYRAYLRRQAASKT